MQGEMEVKVPGASGPDPTDFSWPLELGCCDVCLELEGYLEAAHFSGSWRMCRSLYSDE